MKCPLDKIDLVEKQGEGFTYHECPSCEGLWMRHRALRTLVEKYEPDAVIAMPRPDDAFQAFNSSDFDTNNITICPLDGASYYEHAFGSIMLDICPECDGIWLDKGELAKIRDELKAQKIPDNLLDVVLHDVGAFFAYWFRSDTKKDQP